MLKRILIIIGTLIVLALIIGGVWWWVESRKPITNTPVQVSYELFTAKDAGTTQNAPVRSVVIIQLAKESYAEPIEATQDGKALTLTKEQYNDSLAVSFMVQGSSTIMFKAHALSGQDFTLTITPTE